MYPADTDARIAVVTVHGVADQAPRETVHALANCLLNLDRPPGGVRYTPFNETGVRIATRPVVVAPPPQLQALPAPSQFDESSREVRALHAQIPVPAAAATAAKGATVGVGDFDHLFMRTLLEKYEGEGPDATYDTVRLEGRRLDGPDQVGPHVHLFELYWADLSRLGTGFQRIFTEFYQLLFHVSDIGLQTVDYARATYPGTPQWKYLNFFHALAVRFLTLPIPILNLLLLAVILLALPGNLKPTYHPLVVFAVFDVAV